MHLRNGKTTSKTRDLKRKTLSSRNSKNDDSIPEKRQKIQTFSNIGDLIAAIPSISIRKTIFSHLPNQTKLNLLPLFSDKKHHKFLRSCPDAWKRLTLLTDGE